MASFVEMLVVRLGFEPKQHFLCFCRKFERFQLNLQIIFGLDFFFPKLLRHCFQWILRASSFDVQKCLRSNFSRSQSRNLVFLPSKLTVLLPAYLWSRKMQLLFECLLLITAILTQATVQEEKDLRIWTACYPHNFEPDIYKLIQTYRVQR